MTAASMRLHITPLNPDLLPAVVGPKVIDLVSNVSYHTIQTFPENNYGYLDLPRMEAEKVKKKVNGAILKGKKIKIEEARPKKRLRLQDSAEEAPKQAPAKKVKKSKKERNVINGYELPTDRKVKRGWTEANLSKASKKSKTSSSKSKYSDKDELLFRTIVPPNKKENVEKEKKQKTKSKQKEGEHVVHEFKKSTAQPSFLRQNAGLGISSNLEYIEGRGWADSEGQIIEPEAERVSRQRRAQQAATTIAKSKITQKAASSTSSSSGSEDDSLTDYDESKEHAQADHQLDDETSSSGSSSESDSDIETSEHVSDGDTTGVSKDQAEPLGTEVHPLEALFKKPSKPPSQDVAKPSLEVATSFSFFQSEGDDDGVDEDEMAVPLTPFSSQDVRTRGLRSAAPTPDSAHPSRFNSYGSSGLPGDEDEDVDEVEADQRAATYEQEDRSKGPSVTLSRKQSEFEKKFWENRGDNNRSWKTRRRTVLKEKRQRENKARRPRNW
ncbi:hypothetical protein PV08_03858 [Exophiala spinifera]|uniref:Suppressor protein SRP40 n=1 Tax=Exophiala spinifera TaxID=91928 RepID=A0A0D2BDG9_9EURO|nr:uncharacterized protein PV08_03858 [Exophiala spinifera]KIW16670.1 hypothetical protein PV08_03858 [Exophiala spinifera]